ncbi:nucleic acid/nucleotide deaminase of polymorphic system toxin [Actinokineospora cianjurensis]|uniref:Nucleic acid/nucleotide deaminase of polymorphic system toxin n=2 Tax=Actinokineospora cianjurensis TaxID=585224 RepID=A0A421AXL9_9PSEU|nr:nucleic acid/nucleotide deaminase of polymorphic system toxin [Actinokineospora cianjurensis]
MTGWVQLDGRDVGEITATRSDPWADDARARLLSLGLRRAKGLNNHVEMKTVTMMIQTNAREGRVIINHAPCGSEPGDPPGCDDVLPAFIPEGRTLTVLGTDAKGDPFKRTYHGKATR